MCTRYAHHAYTISTRYVHHRYTIHTRSVHDASWLDTGSTMVGLTVPLRRHDVTNSRRNRGGSILRRADAIGTGRIIRPAWIAELVKPVGEVEAFHWQPGAASEVRAGFHHDGNVRGPSDVEAEALIRPNCRFLRREDRDISCWIEKRQGRFFRRYLIGPPGSALPPSLALFGASQGVDR
jgi:hypothetical protein